MGKLIKFITTILLVITNMVVGENSQVDSVFSLIKHNALQKGIPESFLFETFYDSTVQSLSEIKEQFARPYEKKSWEEYQKIFITENRISKGVQFYYEQQSVFESVSKAFKNIDTYLLLSIVGIESNYGSHHAQYTVFNSLFTQIATMPKRSKWAQKELIVFLEYCFFDSIPPHSVGGSYAGAFGYGQFIPSSFISYAVDFDKNGRREAYNWPDVIASVANYLLKNGYPSTEKPELVYKAVYSYNHSDNYVRAVLKMRDELEKEIVSEQNLKR